MLAITPPLISISLITVGSSAPTTMHNESTHKPVLQGYNRIDYTHQRKSMKRAYQKIGLVGDAEPWKSTSAGRHVATNTAINGHGGQGGLSDDKTKRLLNWIEKCKSTMDRFYADLPEVDGLANQAGFQAGGPGDYVIHRSKLPPPQELLDMLWAELPEKVIKIKELREALQKGHKDRPTDSLQQILQVLNWLRRVFLQDAPFLMEAFPDHPTWDLHPIFKTEEFKAWSVRIKKHVQESHISGQKHMHKVQTCGDMPLPYMLAVDVARCSDMPCRALTQLHSDQAKVFEGQQAQAVAYQNQTLHTLQEHKEMHKEHKEMLCENKAVRTHLSYHLYLFVVYCVLYILQRAFVTRMPTGGGRFAGRCQRDKGNSEEGGE